MRLREMLILTISVDETIIRWRRWARNVDISSLGSHWPTSAHLAQHWALTGWAGNVTTTAHLVRPVMSAEIITVINIEIF